MDRARPQMLSDAQGLELALRRAKRALGRTGDNPAVGCLILGKAGQTLGLAATADGGRPHAEIVALGQAGAAARGASAYVTLEPCAHQGRSGPCCEALVDAGVTRLVIGARDQNPLVSGRGAVYLRRGGVAVVEAQDAACKVHHAGFNRRMLGGAGKVILKIATSLDGGMTRKGATTRVKITGPEVQSQVHLLRAQADVLITGRGTVQVDRPQLTVRLPGYRGPQPKVLVWLRGQSLSDVTANTILVEAGPTLATALFDQVDELHWYRSPERFGRAAVRPGFLRAEASAFARDHPSFTLMSRRVYGVDVREIWRKGP